MTCEIYPPIAEVLKLLETRPPLMIPTKFAPHPNTKSTNIEHKNNLLAINFHQWDRCGCFSEIKNSIPGFAADNAHLRSASQSKVVSRPCHHVHECRKVNITY